MTSTLLAPPTPAVCQRWRQGHSGFRPVGERFDPSRHEVVLLDHADARAFIETHHYSHSYPSARLRVGLLRKEPFQKERLAGVAVFSVPINNAAIPKYLGVEPSRGVELGRLVLLDEIESNAESWFVARAFRLLRRELPEVLGVISYSDPVPRWTADGKLVMPGHLGIIYQALNARYFGRSAPRTLLMAADGRTLSERTLCKLRGEESGAEGAYRQALSMGAPLRFPHESGADYVRRLLESGAFRKVRHPGNHAYAWRLDTPRWENGLTPLPYPKHLDVAVSA